jgi:hypothetical protein
MPVARLGNVAVREVIGADDDGTPIHRRYRGQSTTEIQLPGDEEAWTHDERVRTVAHDDGHWRAHSSKPPAWVESDDPVLAAALAAEFGCPIGRPAGWVDHIEPEGA